MMIVNAPMQLEYCLPCRPDPPNLLPFLVSFFRPWIQRFGLFSLGPIRAPLCVESWCLQQHRVQCLLSNSLLPGSVLAADPADCSKHPRSVGLGSAAQSGRLPRLSDASLSSPAQSSLLARDWHNWCVCVCWAIFLSFYFAVVECFSLLLICNGLCCLARFPLSVWPCYRTEDKNALGGHVRTSYCWEYLGIFWR